MKLVFFVSLFTWLIPINSICQITVIFKDSTNNNILSNVNAINYTQGYGSSSNENGVLVIPKGVLGKFIFSIVGYGKVEKEILSDTTIQILLPRKILKDSNIIISPQKYAKSKKVGNLKKGTKYSVTPFMGKYVFADYINLEPNNLGLLENLKFRFVTGDFDYNNDLIEIKVYGINAEETFMEKLNDEQIIYQLKNKNQKVSLDLSTYNLKTTYPNILITFEILHEIIDNTKRNYLVLTRQMEKPFPFLISSKINLSPALKIRNSSVKTELIIKPFKKK